MFRSLVRATGKVPLNGVAPSVRVTRRLLSTAPPHQKSRSWKSSASRWGLAGALVYYYHTATVFAEEPAYAVHAPPETSRESEQYSTVASISEQRQARALANQQKPSSLSPQAPEVEVVAEIPDGQQPAPGSPEALEEEAEQQGAFNEETGEINWECPCLGGMAYGPCGEQFRAAFSCFVYSKEEPKGVECIENFKAMQNCFRDHPDVYGAELEDDEDDPASAGASEGDPTPAVSQPAHLPQDGTRQPEKVAHTRPLAASTPSAEAGERAQRAQYATTAVGEAYQPQSESDELMPKAWHDNRSSEGR